MWKGINGDIAWTLDAHYYLGCGNRGGREREIVYWVDDMSYQNKVGTLTNGAHPGACNGQDVYSDLLITEKGQNVDKLGWSASRSNTNDEQCGRRATNAG